MISLQQYSFPNTGPQKQKNLPPLGDRFSSRFRRQVFELENDFVFVWFVRYPIATRSYVALRYLLVFCSKTSEVYKGVIREGLYAERVSEAGNIHAGQFVLLSGKQS